MGKSRRNKSKNQKVNTYSCPLCTLPDEGDMVYCDWCEKWFHFSCGNLSVAPTEAIWICPSCRKQHQENQLRQNLTNTSNVTVEKLNDDELVTCQNIPKGATRKDPNRYLNSKESTSQKVQEGSYKLRSSFGELSVQDQRIRIKCQRFEEEKLLEQQIQFEKFQLEKAFLDRKYEILLQGYQLASATEELTKNFFGTNNQIDNLKEQEEIDMEDFNRRLNALKFTPTADEKLRNKPGNFNPKTEDFSWRNFYYEGSISSDDTHCPFRVEPKFNEHQSPVGQPNVFKRVGNNQYVGAGEHALTKAQIAARQVVTKDLPFFYGKPEDWSIFHKRFVNSTELCGYTNGENLDRLQKCLKGSAHDAVRDLLLDAESVPDILKTLEMLFGRSELIVKNLLKQIRLLPNPKVDNLNSIITFALDVRNLSKTVERKEMHQYLSNPILLQELVDRLPTTYKVDWARYIVNIPDNKLTLVTLSDWLYKLMQAVIKVTEFVPKDSDKKIEKQIKSSERVNVHQVEKDKGNSSIAFLPEKSPDCVKGENRCTICRKNCKFVQDCEVFKSFQIDQRWKAIIDNKLCRKCLRRHSGFCRATKECGVNNCTYKHHSLLHNDQRHKPNQDQKNQKPAASNETVMQSDINASHIGVNVRVLLRILPIKIFANGITLDTFAFLDDGSTTTLIDEKLADELNLDGVKRDLCLIWSSNIHRKEKNSRQVSVIISSIDNPKLQFKLKEVKTVNNLGIPSQRLNKDELCKRFSYLDNIPFKSYENGVPGILIGSNNPRIGIPRKVVDRGDFEPIAAKTKIGWSIHGPIDKFDSSEGYKMNHFQIEECKCQHDLDESLHQSMKDYFSIDNFGVQVPPMLCTLSKENEKALQQLDSLTKRVDGRFETGLLWRYENFVLPESFWMAKRRLECLERKKPETIQIIEDTIQEYIKSMIRIAVRLF
ncbi:hypothetical protein Bhyg_12281 [Pseudolycoriella hygida]|uniref:PHD-type domain-containing protein n=1 Tax=Pseudolycoriella hygida TaxID=35572 RepID=A0A9Q0MX92_9DIPT|nr:hypothetical protein Bhyg_12281 [Pseudolycoriella hygida]